jgi:hypothetical protein
MNIITRPQATLNAWSHVQARHHQIRHGYQSSRYSDSDSVDRITTINVTETFSNFSKCYRIVPAPIDLNTTLRIIGGNVNGLKPYGDMASIITVSERLFALQAGTMELSEINVEWHKFKPRENM